MIQKIKFSGLDTKEARRRLELYGTNEIRETEKTSPLKILLRQIKNNFIIYLLLAAALLSFLVGKEITAYTILAVIAFVIASGFIQEYKAEKAIAALKGMLKPVSTALRDGRLQEVPSRELVPGDTVFLRNGERVPADGLIVEDKNLRINEAVLTGETKEVKKSAAGAESVNSEINTSTNEENLVFMGTHLVEGKGTMKILHTGMNTRFGKIAGLINTTEKTLPLQTKVNRITKYMVAVALTVSLATGLLMAIRSPTLTPETLTNILILVIALAVSAFPEGFPVVLTSALAVGAVRMARQNAIVNRMSVIETLGETTVICADKTGTITQGEMTVKEVFRLSGALEVLGIGYEAEGKFLKAGVVLDPASDPDLQIFSRAVAICNEAFLSKTGENNLYQPHGSPTEAALLILAAKAGVFKEDLEYSVVEETPFNSARKMMSVFCREEKRLFVYAKGAPEVILPLCPFAQKNGERETLTKENQEKIMSANHQITNRTLRTIAIAFKEIPTADSIGGSSDYGENGLTFLGLAAMEDPPRPEIRQALNLAAQAGIRVIMITGDNQETARAIAQEIGLKGEIMVGREIDNSTDAELTEKIKETAIFARVHPEHKLRIVRLLKEQGETVAMTGDGVNDAPALKEAHIGIAMGKNGTDVSRSVADLVLKDDNFATIITAIKEGRTIFNNIRKFASYQLSCNLAELQIIFVGVLLSPWLGWTIPLLAPIQILFMNLVTDNLPAITLGLNRSSPDILEQKPRRRSVILNSELIKLLIFNGCLMGGLTLLTYFVSYNLLGLPHPVSQTTALLTLILVEIASAFNFRSYRFGVLNRALLANPYLVYASIISLLATLAVIYFPPAQEIFETWPLKLSNWLPPLAVTLIIVIIFDIAKRVRGSLISVSIAE